MPLPALDGTFCRGCYTGHWWTLGGGDQTIWLLCRDKGRQATHLPHSFRGRHEVRQFCTLDIHEVYRLHSHDQHTFVPLLRRIFTMVIALVLLAFSFTNLIIEPIQEAIMTPQKIYTTPTTQSLKDGVAGENWSIIAVSKISVFQTCLFRTVTTCHWQFAKNYTFGDESKLHDAINVNAKWDNENGKSLASRWAGHSVWVATSFHLRHQKKLRAWRQHHCYEWV